MINFKLKSFLFFLIINSVSLCAYDSSLEFRAAAFFPSSHRFREIYGDVAPSYQLEASTKFLTHLEGWANLDWIPKSGHSVGAHDSTRINIGNFSLGFKIPWKITKITSMYLGIGPSIGGIWIKNHSQCNSHTDSKVIYGGVVKAGFKLLPTKYFIIEFFADYLYNPVNFESHLNVGGFKTGIGIGFNFP